MDNTLLKYRKNMVTALSSEWVRSYLPGVILVGGVWRKNASTALLKSVYGLSGHSPPPPAPK
jgi:hypothetical protein